MINNEKIYVRPVARARLAKYNANLQKINGVTPQQLEPQQIEFLKHYQNCGDEIKAAELAGYSETYYRQLRKRLMMYLENIENVIFCEPLKG